MMVKKLIALTEEFTQLLELEKKLLKQRKLNEAGALHSEKDRLNGEYHLAVLQMRSDRVYMNSLSTEDVEWLAGSTKKLKDCLEENRALLSVISQANSRILFALADRFAARSPVVHSYSPFGASVKGGKTKVAALTVNTCI